MLAVLRFAAVAMIILSSSTATAAFVIEPDEICAPTDDPCVIDEPYEVSYAAPLDFGLRKVLVTGAGRLTGNMELSCGSFESDVETRWIEVLGSELTRQATIHARRGCSGDPDAPCIQDHDCSQTGLGKCSVGDGSIVLAGEAFGVGAGIGLHAAGDVLLAGDVRMSGEAPGFPPVEAGGGIFAESAHGSIEVESDLFVDAGPNLREPGPNEAGSIGFRARRHIRIRGLLSAIGGLGSLRFDAGGDVILEAPIDAHGVSESDYDGTTLTVTAGRDILIQPAPGQERLDCNMHGGGDIDSDGSTAGSGGDGTLRAGRDIRVAAGVRINANSGRIPDRPENSAYGGTWFLDAGDDIEFEGRLRARGRGPTGTGQSLWLRAGDDVSIGLAALLTLRSRDGGEIALTSRKGGNLAIHGHLNVRGGRRKDRYGDRTGHGGTIEVNGGNLSMVGTMESGGGETGGYLRFDVCRFHLFPGARIDGSRDEQEYRPTDLTIYVGESMTADPGSLLALKPQSSSFVAYRDAAKPPILQGTTIPQPQLYVSDLLDGCAVCGNREIDQFETCDDGNDADADGCDENCQIEPPDLTRKDK